MSQAQRRALVIDDDPRVRTLLGEFLEVLGYEVRSAAEGAEGLRLFAPGRDKLVVTDLMMPGVTGWEVAETVRRDDPEIAVIIATGSVSNLDTHRLRELRVVLLSKPFTLQELRAALDDARTLAAVSPTATRLTGGEAVPDPERQGVAVTPERSGGWLGELRTAAEMTRALSANLAASLAHVEEAIRERDDLRIRLSRLEHEHGRLRDAHEALVRAMESSDAAYRQLQSAHETLRQRFEQTNEECQTLRSERNGVVSTLERILARFQR